MCHNFTQLWKGARDMEIQEKPEKCSGGGNKQPSPGRQVPRRELAGKLGSWAGPALQVGPQGGWMERSVESSGPFRALPL